ncbi:MAG TPA: YggS family pyridoxal phosphate-dependent enzyme [Actinocrinis sp.]
MSDGSAPARDSGHDGAFGHDGAEGLEHGSAEELEHSAEDPRGAQIARNLARVRERIAAACAAAGRGPDSVGLVAVTKFFPAEDALRLIRHGVRHLGENRDQEAAPKAAQVREALGEPARPAVSWHFIGQLQTNKARSVVAYADVIESVDRLKLVAALAAAADGAGRSPLCLVQVNLDPAAAGRGGAEPGEVERIADAVALSRALRLGGLMAVAPLGADPAPAFEQLAAIHAKLRGAHAEAVSLSAGMSGDLEQAVAVGATHVRIGSALLGRRPPLR